jgi:hypothetical protein
MLDEHFLFLANRFVSGKYFLPVEQFSFCWKTVSVTTHVSPVLLNPFIYKKNHAISSTVNPCNTSHCVQQVTETLADSNLLNV